MVTILSFIFPLICFYYLYSFQVSSSAHSSNMNVNDVAEVLSPIVAGAASLARRLAASKAAANGTPMPPAVADEVAPALGPVTPLDVSLDPEKLIFTV